MRSRGVSCCLALLPLVAGCGRTPAPIPPADQIESVRITVTHSPTGAALKVPCDTTWTERPDVAEVVTWLEGFDWSQRGTDLSVVHVRPAEGSIVIKAKDGATAEFDFYWDGGLIHRRANRLLRGGDMVKWKRLTERICR